MDDLKTYYDRRAGEYEEVYLRDEPGLQDELAVMRIELRQIFKGKRVLEVACGTGYWTEVLAEVAHNIVAVDASRNMLDRAGQRLVAADNVELALADAYRLEEVAGTFDAALANYWLSHVPKARLNEFLEGLHRKLAPGSVIFMADNVYREGRGGELIQPEGRADSYKRRKLENGAEYEILKNYYDRDALEILFAAHADTLKITTGQYSWWVNYTV